MVALPFGGSEVVGTNNAARRDHCTPCGNTTVSRMICNRAANTSHHFACQKGKKKEGKWGGGGEENRSASPIKNSDSKSFGNEKEHLGFPFKTLQSTHVGRI